MSCQCSGNLTHLLQEHKRLLFKEGVKPSELGRNSFGARHSAELVGPNLGSWEGQIYERLWRGRWW